MNPAPHAPLLPDGQALPALSLDERIRRAEQRLIARELDLRQRIDRLTFGARQAVQPKRWIAPAVGGAITLTALWLLLRGRGLPREMLRQGAARVRTAAAGAMPAAGVASAEVPWPRLLALAWPLLPAAWRARVSPATAAALVSVGLPLAERWWSERHAKRSNQGRTNEGRTNEEQPAAPAGEGGAASQPQAAEQPLDLTRCAGTWYEVAQLPALSASGAAQPQWECVVRGHGLQLLQRWRDRRGHEHVRRGVGQPVTEQGHTTLRVSMRPAWLRGLAAWAGVHVLWFDGESALLGHRDRRRLWVLSRTPQMLPAQLDALTALAAQHGFPVHRLQAVPGAPQREPRAEPMHPASAAP